LRRTLFFSEAPVRSWGYYLRVHMSPLTSYRRASQPNYKAFYCRMPVATGPLRIFAAMPLLSLSTKSAHSSGLRQRSGTSAAEGKPDCRRTRPAQPFLTQAVHKRARLAPGFVRSETDEDLVHRRGKISRIEPPVARITGSRSASLDCRVAAALTSTPAVD